MNYVVFSGDDCEEELLDKTSKPGRFTYISISKIRRVVPLLTLVLVLAMESFIAFEGNAWDFSSFEGAHKWAFKKVFVGWVHCQSLFDLRPFQRLVHR